MTNIFNCLIDKAQNNQIPPPNDINLTGTSFIQQNWINSNREENILNSFLNGNIPNFLRNLFPIEINENNHHLIYLVTSDYLSIGNDLDYVRIPMNPLTAQSIADKYDCSLPTTKMVYDIWKSSPIKLEPLPWGPPFDSSMSSSFRIFEHNRRIQQQLINKNNKTLISGHKKDVVLSNNIIKGNVAIYGWIKNGTPIQPLNTKSHNNLYSDYSHGIRLISNDVFLDGKFMKLQDLFSDPDLCSLVSNEGTLSVIRY